MPLPLALPPGARGARAAGLVDADPAGLVDLVDADVGQGAPADADPVGLVDFTGMSAIYLGTYSVIFSAVAAGEGNNDSVGLICVFHWISIWKMRSGALRGK